MTQNPEIPPFRTPEEFGQICHALAAVLNSKNRTSMGESHFVADLADLIRRTGDAFEKHYGDPEIKAAFGDGWTAGTLDRNDRARALFELLYENSQQKL